MRRIPLYSQIIAAMVIGIVVGLIFGAKTAALGEIGKTIIQLVKVFAGPLLFFAVTDAFIRTQVQLKSAGRMVAISLINAVIALAIGLTISNVFQPGRHMRLEAKTPLALEKIDPIKSIIGYVPQNILQPFAENSILAIVAFAILTGLALRRLRSAQTKSAEDLVTTGLKVTELILAWIIKLIPLAVLTVVATTVGRYGFAPLKGLAAYLAVGLLGLTIHILVTYQFWLKFIAKVPLKFFWRGARDPIVYVTGAASSLATLPVTLKALDSMKVSPTSARLAACVGTNLNNDGILLYEAMAVLFVAQAHGIELSTGQQILAALSCALAGFGIAGIPDAGLISLSLVLTTVGLPLEILPMLLTVDWIMGRARALTNVVSDMTVAVVLDKLDGAKRIFS